MKNRIEIVGLAFVSVVFLLASPASADIQGNLNSGPADPPLPVDGAWQGPFDEFNGGVGSFFQETWTLSGPAELQVTDLYVIGDQYAIYDNNNLIGNSSVPPHDYSFYGNPGDPPYTTDPATAWASSAFSHFDAVLGAGAHSITIQSTALPAGFLDGTYSIRAVPEPARVIGLVGLIGMGLIGLVYNRRRAA